MTRSRKPIARRGRWGPGASLIAEISERRRHEADIMLRSPTEKRARFAARLAAALHTVRDGDRIADVSWAVSVIAALWPSRRGYNIRTRTSVFRHPFSTCDRRQEACRVREPF